MSVAFKIDGLAELRSALLHAPPQIQSKAEAVVRNVVDEAASEMRVRYQKHRTPTDWYWPGKKRRQKRRHLADNVKVTFRGAATGAAQGRIIVDAPHAHLFEFGTAQRRWKSGKSTGAAPAPPQKIFIPIAVRKRKHMTEELIDVVEGMGLKVTRG